MSDYINMNSTPNDTAVIDIGGSRLGDRLKGSIAKKLQTKDSLGRYFLPDVFFSDDVGLTLWRDINRQPNYYQTRDEVELLEKHVKSIAQHIPDHATIIDLGCGDVRKIRPALDLLEEQGRQVTYYGLDLSLVTVTQSINELRSLYTNVHCIGLWGTFEDGLEWVQNVKGPRVFLSLGSIFGNDRFDRAVKFLKIWADAMGKDDCMLLGVDGTQDKDVVWNSYHDAGGLFEYFIRNGFLYSNKVLGGDWFRNEDWELSGVLEENPTRHHFSLRAVRDVNYNPAQLHFVAGDTIECYEGTKNGPGIMREQFSLAGLREIESWVSPSGRIYEYLVKRTA